MKYRVSIPPQVADALRRLPPAIKRDAKQALRILSDDPHAGQPLERELKGLWKYRIRAFRIVYRPVADQRLIQVMGIGPRSRIYDVIRAAVHRGHAEKYTDERVAELLEGAFGLFLEGFHEPQIAELQEEPLVSGVVRQIKMPRQLDI